MPRPLLVASRARRALRCRSGLVLSATHDVRLPSQSSLAAIRRLHESASSLSSSASDSSPSSSAAAGGPTLAIDSTGLLGRKHTHAADAAVNKPPVTPLLAMLKDSISTRGPLSVAEFMKQALAHPTLGYYTKARERRDVFGRAGDFTTSPEVSQMFGELVGVWLVATWQQLAAQLGSNNARFRLVECGPGRGTLANDVLKVARKFPFFAHACEGLHLIETSPALRLVQAATLSCGKTVDPSSSTTESDSASKEEKGDGVFLFSESQRVGPSGSLPGLQVHWHDRLDSIPGGTPLIFIAHELFDALPVHQFVRQTGGGWRERLVDVDDSE